MSAQPLNQNIDPTVNLEQARRDSQALVKKAALISAGGAIVPIPFFDLMVDLGVLSKLLPEINAKFGLPHDHVTVYDPATKKVNWDALRQRGLEMSSYVVARTAAKGAVNSFVGRMLTRQVTKFIPLGGSLVAGTLGYMMTKKIAEAHIDECYQNAQRLRAEQNRKVVNG